MTQRIKTVPFGSRCPYCGCTDRTRYEGVKRTPIRSGNGSGQAFFVSRRTSCRRCGKKRKETRVEFPE